MSSSPFSLSITNSTYSKCRSPDLCGSCPHCQARHWLSLTRDWLTSSQRRAQLDFSCWLAVKLPQSVLDRLLNILPQPSPKEGLAALFTFTRTPPVQKPRSKWSRANKQQQQELRPIEELIRGWLEEAAAPVLLYYSLCILRELGAEQVLAFVRTARDSGLGLLNNKPHVKRLYTPQLLPVDNTACRPRYHSQPADKHYSHLTEQITDAEIHHHTHEGTFNLFRSSELMLEEDPLPPLDPLLSHLSSCDLIRHLPVHISKFILHLLPPYALVCCMLVSRHWNQLAREVNLEKQLRNRIEHSIKAHQGISAKVCNPRYASLVSVEELDETIGKSPFLLMRRLKRSRFGRSECLQGGSTRVEERNIFCGSYSLTSFVLPLGMLGSICSYDNNIVAVGGNEGKVHLLDNRGKLLYTFTAHAAVVKSILLATVPSGSHIDHVLVTGSFDLTIRLWSLRTRRYMRIFIGHMKSVICLDLKEGQLLSGSCDKSARLWDVYTGNCIHIFHHSSIVTSVRVSHEKYVTGCEDGVVFTWDHRTCRILRRLEEHTDVITCLSLDSMFLMSSGRDGEVKQWLASSPSCRSVRSYSHPVPVTCHHFMYLRLITTATDGKIRVWNMIDGSCLKIIIGSANLEPIHSLSILNNKMLVCSKHTVSSFQFEEEKWDYQTEFAGQGYLIKQKLTK
ncbi:CMT1A duplicated region transcript 1 protein isoform X3 [Oopsacas minuta]|uniref:CMT1A duplicated region transcript 1 protein isoform X3 n=1 Tax=Oopsacas minuta TaxID=111878 RepID=A0AAV7K8N5_9METZ|nr:CMT1A duplicated region transcript 1 protein isoform X3 [Oopsacas minuta]